MTQGNHAGWRATGLLIALLLSGPGIVGAQEKTQEQRSPSEKSYQAGDSSPVGQAVMHHNINPKAPPLGAL